MTDTVLVIGGYGVFGGHLSKALNAAGYNVIVAGRSRKKAEAFCRSYGGQPLVLDTRADGLEKEIAAISPAILVDAAGPYQAYGPSPYRIAEAAIACGAHYLDLSDDGAFTAGINALDEQARAANVTALSGVSSVPALSSTVAAHLCNGLSEIELIQSAIVPGNKAPRGHSVIASILAQTGQPLKQWRAGRWTEAKGWTGTRYVDLHVPGAAPVRGRRESFIGAPDLTLFPKHFSARSVLFRAGLDLAIMHRGLSALSWLVRRRVLRSALPLIVPLKWCADRLERFGSDRGGMYVRVVGKTQPNAPIERLWTLIAETGDGPKIPAVPARILIPKLLAGDIAPGARPCLSEFTLDDAAACLATLDTCWDIREAPPRQLFADALGGAFSTLPSPLRELHTVFDRQHWSGLAKVTRGTNALSKLAGKIAGFPKAGEDIPVTVMMERTSKGETWTRQFGQETFRSRLSRSSDALPGRISERFGLLSFDIALEWDGTALSYPVTAGRCLGIPLPRALLPRSDTREFVDAEGRCNFDVGIHLPIAGLVAQYKGWLKPA